MKKGVVTSYDKSSRIGQINDDQNNEYRFTKADWQAKSTPTPGTTVRFENMSDKAYRIEVIELEKPVIEPGSPQLAWLTLFLAFSYMLQIFNEVAKAKNLSNLSDGMQGIGVALSTSMLVGVTLIATGYAIGRGRRGRLIAIVSAVMNMLALKFCVGFIVDLIKRTIE